MTNDQIEDLMRQAGLEAIADKDYRASAGEPMTVTEQDRYDAVLWFAQEVAKVAREEAIRGLGRNGGEG